MSWLNNPSFSVDEAQTRGIDVYEVLFSDWGYASFDGFGNLAANAQWPPQGLLGVPLTLAGIAIGPRSTIDRCFVSYNLQKHTTDGSHAIDRMRRLSVDSPLIYSQASPTPNQKGLAADGTGAIYQTQALTGPLVITPFVRGAFDAYTYPNGVGAFESTALPANYRDVNNVLRTFAGSTTEWQVMSPTLHLLLYLKGPPVFVPTKRFPLQISGATKPVAIPDGTEIIVAQIPVYGRRSFRLTIKEVNAVAGTFDFRIGGLRDLGGTLSQPSEEPVDSITGVAASVPVIMSSCAGQNLFLDYLNIYATGHGSGNAMQLQWRLSAYD